jgi:hypothetical protein
VDAPFADRAKEFVKRIQELDLHPTTEVALIYHFADADGRPLGHSRVSAIPQVTVSLSTDLDATRGAAINRLRARIVDKINSLVRSIPLGPVDVGGLPGQTVYIQDVSLEVKG